MRLQRIYNLLLWLYPREYRELFGSEMSIAFDEAARDRRQGTGLAAPGFIFREMTGLGLAAAHEWIVKLLYSVSHSVNYIDGRCLPDPLLMRAPGVSWLEHYNWGRRVATACESGNRGPACLNAYQTFTLASPFRRLLILIIGPRQCGRSCKTIR